jgi:hypothetical protein
MLILCGVTHIALASPPLSRPQQDYILHCQGCHGANGSGTVGHVPALRSTFIPLLQVNGGRDYLLRVPGVANTVLKPAATAAVMNWLLSQFATEINKDVLFSVEEVTTARGEPLLSVRATRGELFARIRSEKKLNLDDY